MAEMFSQNVVLRNVIRCLHFQWVSHVFHITIPSAFFDKISLCVTRDYFPERNPPSTDFLWLLAYRSSSCLFYSFWSILYYRHQQFSSVFLIPIDFVTFHQRPEGIKFITTLNRNKDLQKCWKIERNCVWKSDSLWIINEPTKKYFLENF